MTDVPENFPSYTAYNAKQVLLHVDTMKLILKELQAEVASLKTSLKKKETKNGSKEERQSD